MPSGCSSMSCKTTAEPAGTSSCNRTPAENGPSPGTSSLTPASKSPAETSVRREAGEKRLVELSESAPYASTNPANPAAAESALAVRWLVEFARQRREKTMAQRLANELMDAQSQQGSAYKRKDDIYRMAQANKAFAHYRW